MKQYRKALVSGVVTAASVLAVGAGAAAAAAVPSRSSSSAGQMPTVHPATARVGAVTETILVNAKGLPLYYFKADTAKTSKVSGQLAQLWPPLVSARPTASGVSGRVVALKEAGGRQVAYNGHFLYTFVDDSPGHVTGQGVSHFFVATPTIAAIGNSTVVKAAPAPAASSRGYGY